MGEEMFPKFHYYLDESDPDVVILRRQDGAFVGAFSARGATKEGILEAAKEDYRKLLLGLRAREGQELSLDELPEHSAIVDNSGTIVAVNKAWKRFAKDNGADLSKVSAGATTCMFVRGLRVSNPSTLTPLVRGFVRFSVAEKSASRWNILATRPPRGAGSWGEWSALPRVI
jgi:hypothetical protein